MLAQSRFLAQAIEFLADLVLCTPYGVCRWRRLKSDTSPGGLVPNVKVQILWDSE